MERHWILVQNGLCLAVLVLGWRFPGAAPSPLGQTIAGSLMALGAILGFAGVVALGPNRSPHPRPLAHARLVRHGIYRRVRHPLYGSLMLLTAGWTLFHMSSAAAGATMGLIGWLWAKARVEERYLRQRHPEYDDYARRTRAFLPVPGKRVED